MGQCFSQRYGATKGERALAQRAEADRRKIRIASKGPGEFQEERLCVSFWQVISTQDGEGSIGRSSMHWHAHSSRLRQAARTTTTTLVAPRIGAVRAIARASASKEEPTKAASILHRLAT